MSASTASGKAESPKAMSLSPRPFKPNWMAFWVLSVLVVVWLVALIVLWYTTVRGRVDRRDDATLHPNAVMRVAAMADA